MNDREDENMNIAIVDDDREDAALLEKYMEKYFAGTNGQYHIFVYESGLDFLEDFGRNFDIVFMDIEMPHLDGIETARKMRRMDETVVLIFITNMAQYAICGYEVNAIEFMVKPVGFYNFSDKIAKALKFVKRDTEKKLLLHDGETIVRLSVSKIFYLEKDKNYVLFHTESGEYKERGTMAEMEEKLTGLGFSKCITGCLVNLRYVSRLSKDAVWVGDRCLPLSRKQKKIFVKEFADFMGGEWV